MAETNDTIDGLLAEFRGYSAGMPPSYHVTMSWADFRRMLDRFDAAHRRERNRNCDRFATADEAIGAYRQTHKHMVVNVFLDWLFAPETEKEGGAK